MAFYGAYISSHLESKACLKKKLYEDFFFFFTSSQTGMFLRHTYGEPSGRSNSLLSCIGQQD